MQVQKLSASESRQSPLFFSSNNLQHRQMLEQHSLVRTLPVSFDIAAIPERIAILQPELAKYGIVFSFWHETLLGLREDAASLAALEKECDRLVAPGQTARILLLSYGDGGGDLILCARKLQMDFSSLCKVSQFLQDGQPFDLTAFSVTAEARPAPAVLAQPLPWGCGNVTRRGEIGHIPFPAVMSGGADLPSRLAAATGLLLSQYGLESPQLALIQADAHQAPTLSYMMFSSSAESSVLDFLTTARRREHCAFIDAALPSVGIVWTELPESVKYTACYGALFPVTLVCQQDSHGEMSGQILFDQGVISECMAEQFVILLTRFLHRVEHLGEQVAASALIRPDEDEQRTILAAGNHRINEITERQTIPEAFEAMVKSQPDLPAVSDEKSCLSYRELNLQADALAAALRCAGIGRGDKVGVCLDRNVELVVSLLAVMKAGAAYVPMDAKYPPERLIYTVQDAGLTLVITDAEDFPAVAGVNICTPAELLSAASVSSPVTDAPLPDDLAYVIYTSGSTGKPKGVAIPHHNVGTLLAATRDDMKLGNTDVWTLFHSSAFDFSVWEIWGCLLSGGHLFVVSYWTSRSPEDFYQLLADKGVTILNQTPSAFSALQEVDECCRKPLALRLVIFGGEALNVKTFSSWIRRHPISHCRLVNMFGITETTVHVTRQTITPAMIKNGDKSVGRALPGWSISVRDTKGAVLPYGTPGEIWVGGKALASHYLNQPELTASRFAVDPLSGERVYRSGDLGRMHADGSLDHLGRIDSQVKVRGFRIELEEIRAVLLAAPQVSAAAVLLNQTEAADNASVQIDAYVVLTEGAHADTLRAQAAKYLPDYMVPSSFTVVSHIPLTPNGKIAGAALRQMKAEPQSPAKPEPQESGAQADPLLQVWRHTLARDVSLEEDFFESGGNSLLAVRLCAAIRELGLGDVSLRDLYMHSTPAELKAYLQNE